MHTNLYPQTFYPTMVGKQKQNIESWKIHSFIGTWKKVAFVLTLMTSIFVDIQKF